MIDLNDAKLHLRVDGNEENSIIQLYIDAGLNPFEVREVLQDNGIR